MKVIILKTNEVKDISLGYAVNYLLPKKLAVIATKKKLKSLKENQKKEAKNRVEKKLIDRRKAEKLDGKVIKLKVRAGKNGKIHGSIAKKDIAKELKLMKSEVEMEKPIKKIGDYEVGLKFGKTKARVKVKVEAE